MKGACKGGVLADQQERVYWKLLCNTEAGSFPEEMTRALKKAIRAGGSHREGLCVCVHLACIFHEETQNSRFSYVHVWRHITRALGTVIACIPIHITSKDL